MTETEILDNNYSSGIGLTPEIKGYLRETAKWAKFLAIVGFVFIGLFVLIAIFMGAFMGAMASSLDNTEMPLPAASFSIVYLVMAAIWVFPVLYLYRFASNMQTALTINDEAALTVSFKNLKSHYKFYGIFMAIVLGFYALIFVVALLFGGLSSLMM